MVYLFKVLLLARVSSVRRSGLVGGINIVIRGISWTRKAYVMLKSVSLLTHDFEKFTTVKQFQLNPAFRYILREKLVTNDLVMGLFVLLSVR